MTATDSIAQARITLETLKIRLPAYLADADLPPLQVVDGELKKEDVRVVLWALRTISDEKLSGEGGNAAARKLIRELKTQVTLHSLNSFAWKLFEAWLAGEAQSKDAWAMQSLGYLGGDACAVKLTPLILQWPEANQHKRAAAGLEVLDRIGTDTALTQLNLLAKKGGSPALKKKATEFMKAIASRRGMTTDELEDRIVPDCGLDENGRRVFDFGPRQFDLILGPELKQLLRLPSGKLQASLPAANAKDDAAKVEICKTDWTVLKKLISETLKSQATRMKNAMVHRRRWKTPDFERFCLRHPVLLHLTRAILWNGTAADESQSLFRVTEERECLDLDEKPVSLAFESIAIVHPAALEESLLHRWSQLFNDYQLIAPFPQLGRPVYRVDPTEAQTLEITRYKGVSVSGASLVYPLRNIGWDFRGGDLVKVFPETDTTAVFETEGDASSVFYDPAHPLKMGTCYFERSTNSGSEKLALGTIDSIVYSETVHDLEVVAAKAG